MLIYSFVVNKLKIHLLRNIWKIINKKEKINREIFVNYFYFYFKEDFF